jgi:hypothetical protein
MEYEGGFEGMADYCGRIAITDNPELELAWDTFVKAYIDLDRIHYQWAAEQE